MSAQVPIICSYCHNNIGLVAGTTSCAGNLMCNHCKIRIKYNYDKRTDRITTGRY